MSEQSSEAAKITRAEIADLGEPTYPCCDGYREHRYSCSNREWPATATPEVRRLAVRGDSIGPAHAQIEDLGLHGLNYQQRKRLTEILSVIWDDGYGYGRRLLQPDTP